VRSSERAGATAFGPDRFREHQQEPQPGPRQPFEILLIASDAHRSLEPRNRLVDVSVRPCEAREHQLAGAAIGGRQMGAMEQGTHERSA